MANHIKYHYTLPVRDDRQLHDEIASLAIPSFRGVLGGGNEVQLLFVDQLDSESERRVGGMVRAHIPDTSLPGRRAARDAVARLDRDLLLQAIIAELVGNQGIARIRERLNVAANENASR